MGITKQQYESRLKRIANPIEDDEQIAFITWCDSELSPPECRRMYHCPNGGRRNKAEAAKLKAMGVRKGIPDLFLPIPRQGYHGLYIEMKRLKNGKVSPDQQKEIARLKADGYAVEVANGSEEAKGKVLRYLA